MQWCDAVRCGAVQCSVQCLLLTDKGGRVDRRVVEHAEDVTLPPRWGKGLAAQHSGGSNPTRAVDDLNRDASTDRVEAGGGGSGCGSVQVEELPTPPPSEWMVVEQTAGLLMEMVMAIAAGRWRWR